jgi:hypothetical protein
LLWKAPVLLGKVGVREGGGVGEGLKIKFWLSNSALKVYSITLALHFLT